MSHSAGTHCPVIPSSDMYGWAKEGGQYIPVMSLNKAVPEAITEWAVVRVEDIHLIFGSVNLMFQTMGRPTNCSCNLLYFTMWFYPTKFHKTNGVWFYNLEQFDKTWQDALM